MLTFSGISFADGYKLSEGDTIIIRYLLRTNEIEKIVAGSQADSEEIQLEIPPGGMITLPYIGEVKAYDNTALDLQTEITNRLRKRFPMAECFVLLKAIRRTYFSIIGEVETGGQFELTPRLTLREALAHAGGMLRRPELLRASLFREGKLFQEFDLYNVFSTDDPIGGELIVPGDIISIQTKRQVRVWTAGFTSQPGEVTVEEDRTIQQLLSEIADVSAGGSEEVERREHLFVSVTRKGEEIFRNSVFDVEQGRAPGLLLQDSDFITIAPEERARVWVFGRVTGPGQYDLPVNSTIVQALSVAGGTKSDGTLKGLKILRAEETFTLDISTTTPRPDDRFFALNAGDIIFVGANTRRIAVLGEVNNPGLHFIGDELEPRLSDAISLAEGLTKRGPANRVVILRAKPDGEVERVPVDFSQFLKHGNEEFNPMIEPGDVVVVGETPRIDTRDVVNALLAILGLGNFFR